MWGVTLSTTADGRACAVPAAAGLVCISALSVVLPASGREDLEDQCARGAICITHWRTLLGMPRPRRYPIRMLTRVGFAPVGRPFLWRGMPAMELVMRGLGLDADVDRAAIALCAVRPPGQGPITIAVVGSPGAGRGAREAERSAAGAGMEEL